MTATCREACCSATSRQTVTELFERGYRRNYAAPLSIRGAACTDAEGNSAEFSLELSAGRLAAIGFRATTCATLIAYSELIAETVPGFAIGIAREFSAEDLVDALDDVPELKRGRAALAIAAFRTALDAAEASTSDRHPEVRARVSKRASKEDDRDVTLRGSAASPPRTSG